MIVSNVFGGLGNQLFQYAIAKSLAKSYKTDFVLDVQDFRFHKLRNFELSQLGVQFKLASSWQLFLYGNSFFHKVIRHVLKWSSKKYYAERHGYVYDPEVLHQSRNLYLYGHWQSEKYFLNICDELCKELVVKNPSVEFKTYHTLLAKKDVVYVGLHVRRGDYVKLGLVVCDESYYKKGLDYIRHIVKKDCKVVVFSDDIEWVRKEYDFLGDDAVFVSGLSGPEDLTLMSCCDHFVIANSTFSWRGAWLIQKKDKVIVAPKEWVKHRETPDIIPESWVKL